MDTNTKWAKIHVAHVSRLENMEKSINQEKIDYVDNSPKVELYHVLLELILHSLTILSLIAPFILISIHEIVNCDLIWKEYWLA